MSEIEITFGAGHTLCGVLRVPKKPGPYPVVLLCHGTIEQDRDGNLLSHPSGKPIPKRNFFRLLSSSLNDVGIATFSWDKRGYGSSGIVKGDYYTEAEDAEMAYYCLSDHPLINKSQVFIYGQSAGVHTACLLARSGIVPFRYLLSGGLCSDYFSMLSFNYMRPVWYASRGPKEHAFVMTHDPWGYALGSHLDIIKRAVDTGEPRVFIDYNEEKREWNIDMRLFSGDLAPENLFSWINAPTMIIHGEADMNVPVEDAYKIQAQLSRMNLAHQLVIIPDADHSFQRVSVDPDERIRDRISLECFNRPYIHQYFESICRFCKEAMDAVSN